MESVSLCIIVKNEEAMLEKCICSVKDIVDEIIIVDTGSTDNTIDIAKKYTSKVYEFSWNEDFSAARNFSISKAGCEWIFILDADEVFNMKDCGKFVKLLESPRYESYNFVIYNYIEDNDASDFTMHYALRLFKNNKNYKFKGRIHEQVIRADGKEISQKILSTDIIIYHCGYLESIMKIKNKHDRNLTLLLKQIEEEPDNPFILFNIGNEYMAKKETKKALDFYIKSYKYKDIKQSYCPHLLYRMILCLIEMKQYKPAVCIIDEALCLYPEGTDYEYCRALIYMNTNSYILAAESLRKCIKMGDAPLELRFVNGCGAYRPFLLLGEIYLKNDAYEKAIESYDHALEINPKLIFILYKIGEVVNKLCENKEAVVKYLENYFGDLKRPSNKIVLSDILIQEGLYHQARLIIDDTKEDDLYFEDLNYIKIKLDFYEGKYDSAKQGFTKMVLEERAYTIFKNAESDARRMLNAIDIITDNRLIDEKDDLSLENIFEILEVMLKAKEQKAFDKLLEILDPSVQKDVLLRLAKLYYKYGYTDMAVKIIYKSIGEQNYLDAEAAFILSRETA